MKSWELEAAWKEEGREVGLAEGQYLGERNNMKSLISKKLARGLSVEEIAELFEEDLALVQELAAEIKQDAQ